MPKLVARLGRRSTIVGLPPSAVPNFAKSLIVVARRGFSDAARRSIVSLSERSFFARAPLGCDVSRGRERDVRDESASICLGGAVFREEFDHEPPAACYTPSLRPMPDRLPPLEYPDRFEVRYVSANGGIRWNSRWVNVSIVCVGEYVGLEEIDDGIWTVYFGPLKLGRLHERRMRIEDAYGRLYRHRHV